jgi:hypothetical protein
MFSAIRKTSDIRLIREDKMNWSRRGIALLGAAAAIFMAAEAQAQKPIRIGYPVILSGPGAFDEGRADVRGGD